MPTFISSYLDGFFNAIHGARNEEEKSRLWHGVDNPIIEEISDQTKKLVTFLYRLAPDELDDKTSIYFLSGITGYDFKERSKFSTIPQTDIAYITLTLPCQLRTAYNLVKLRNDEHRPLVITDENPTFYPRLINESAKFDALFNELFLQGRIKTDPLNKKEIIYYKDMDIPNEFYGKESILELPMAPCLNGISTSFEFVKSVRDRLKSTGRLIFDEIQFLETCLGDTPGYEGDLSTRKYWIYLPKDYDPNSRDAYPVMLFLDGSSYLDYIPAHCILEKMIADGVIPPCVAIFLDSPDGVQRSTEYNCNDQFTAFLAHDFMELLRTKHALNITRDPQWSTIIGASYGGLAAFYTGITKPAIFGNVISQSPAFLAQLSSVLEKMIGVYAEESHDGVFAFEMGIYENTPATLEFQDGTLQTTSSLELVHFVMEQMKRHNIPATLHEFAGGHNYVCFRASLWDRIEEVYQNRLEKVDEFVTHCGY